MKRLSIILPIFNVEPYLERCLRSIEDQDIPLEEYEIICINDGSLDNGHDVVAKLQKEFNNIILIDQDNRGVSMARNRGIERAVGNYLLMVDPDDYIQPNVLKEKMDIVEKLNLDVGLTGYTILDEAGEEEYRYDPYYDHNQILTGIEYFRDNLHGRAEIRDPHRSWAIFFKTDFLRSNDLLYLHNIPYLEDGELMARIRCVATRVAFLSNSFYIRTTRPNSATHSNLIRTEKAREGFLKAAHHLLQFRNENNKCFEQKVFLNQPIIQFTSLYITTVEGFSYFKTYSTLRRNLKVGPLRKLDTEGCSHLYRRIGYYYNISIHCFSLFWLTYRIRKSLAIRITQFLSTK